MTILPELDKTTYFDNNKEDIFIKGIKAKEN